MSRFAGKTLKSFIQKRIQNHMKTSAISEKMCSLEPRVQLRIRPVYSYNAFNVYCRQLAPGTVSFTGPRATTVNIELSFFIG